MNTLRELQYAGLVELQKQVYVKPAGTDGNGDLMFEMYVEPRTSYDDIVRHFAEHGIKDFSRPALAIILCNPIYVKADLDIYEFFENQGTVIVNDAADALIFGGILTSICT